MCLGEVWGGGGGIVSASWNITSLCLRWFRWGERFKLCFQQACLFGSKFRCVQRSLLSPKYRLVVVPPRTHNRHNAKKKKEDTLFCNSIPLPRRKPIERCGVYFRVTNGRRLVRSQAKLASLFPFFVPPPLPPPFLFFVFSLSEGTRCLLHRRAASLLVVLL